ncbi:Ger(x)C family spore germination protein [Sporomusa ovata]|uniref:Spore germination protein GerKC n=1 Tax=Sporomusa ovata TaxID=2378 RepID=A0A0U1KS93_9FIRM|nr:Ger(x)C family spore germination C-terminal domain-containing protein [Sporomusa ovata]CQR70257.1 Spore germination protein GerKC [Sporomusa ovata]
MNTRMLLLACTMLVLLVLPGCWDYAEYEDFVQIIGMGMDYNNETQEITLTIVYQPTERKSSSQPDAATKSGVQQIVHSATDKTLIGTVTKLQEVVHKKLFYGYVKTVVIGEEAARYNMMDAIDLFDRSPALHSSAYLAITSGKAADVLQTIDPYQTIPSAEKIQDLIYFAPNTGLAYVVTINTFQEMLAIGGWEATVPHIIAVAAKSQKEETKSSTHEQMRLNEERKGAHRVSGLAAFKGEKFVGWLDEKESQGFCWITGKKYKLTPYQNHQALAVQMKYYIMR